MRKLRAAARRKESRALALRFPALRLVPRRPSAVGGRGLVWTRGLQLLDPEPVERDRCIGSNRFR
jgi:hypothetical protein